MYNFCSGLLHLKTWYTSLLPLLSIRLKMIPRHVRCVSPSLCVSSLCKRVEAQNVTKHTPPKKKQKTIKNTFPQCHPTTRAPQKHTLKWKPIRFFSSLSFSIAFVAQAKALVSMIMVPSTRNKKLQRRTINHQGLCLPRLCC